MIQSGDRHGIHGGQASGCEVLVVGQDAKTSVRTMYYGIYVQTKDTCQ